MRTPVRRNRRGFTLLELLVVMFILVLLAGMVTVLVIKRVDEAKHAKAVADIASLESAINQFKLHNGGYPQTLEGLRTNPSEKDFPNWNGPYITKPVPNDPWGNAYHYDVPGNNNKDSYDLYSFGQDGKEGGQKNDADVTNWQD
jgi:general secretion pathway protein G